MKNLLYNGVILLGIILATSCGQLGEKKKTTNETPYQTLEIIDTSGYFIKELLNSSPKEVARVLGDPDEKIKASEDCDYLPSCDAANYQNGKYEVLYYKNKLKWIVINQKGLLDENSIHYVGFPSWEPTFSNPSFVIRWSDSETRGTATGPLIPIKGLREVMAFHDYIFITVETEFNEKF